MQSHWDPLYEKCCAALRQQRTKSERETAFCEWLSAEFGVSAPIFIAADKPHDKNRLWIVFHIEDERDTFYIQTKEFYGRDKDKQLTILSKAQDLGVLGNIEIFDWSRHLEKPKKWWQTFQRSVAEESPRCELSHWFVAYTAFAPVALSEAVSRVSKKKLKDLRQAFSEAKIWRIERFFDCALVMFHTEADRLNAEKNGVQQKILDDWTNTLRPYDEFGILTHIRPRMKFDSKEVFDRDFNSSWMMYTR